MNKLRGTLLLFAVGICSFGALMLLPIPTTHAAGKRGTIVRRISGCDYFMVQTPTDYAILEWYGGHDPDKDDVLIGDYGSYGFQDFLDETSDSKLRVYVEEYKLTKVDALEKLIDHCE
jgi:hypothetical protein